MFANHEPVLRPGKTIIIVTGVSGFVGSHIADQLVDAGYVVRKPRAMVLRMSGRLNYLATRVSGVIHVASDMTFRSDSHEVIPPTVAGTLALLDAAAKHDSIKRSILSSSCAAAASPEPGVSRVIDQDTWNNAVTKLAWAPPPYDPSRGFSVYAASKAQSEREAWQWYKRYKPRFILSTEHHGHPSTPGLIAALFNNDIETVKTGAQFSLADFCLSVEDHARLHVATLLHPDVSNERIFAYGQPYTWRGMQGLLQKLYPEKTLAPDMLNAAPDGSEVVLALRPLGLLQDLGQDGWTGLEEILAIETRAAARSGDDMPYILTTFTCPTPPPAPHAYCATSSLATTSQPETPPPATSIPYQRHSTSDDDSVSASAPLIRPSPAHISRHAPTPGAAAAPTFTVYPTALLRLPILALLSISTAFLATSGPRRSIPALVFLAIALLRTALVLASPAPLIARWNGGRGIAAGVDAAIVAALLGTLLLAFSNRNDYYYLGAGNVPGCIVGWVAIPIYALASIDTGCTSRIAVSVTLGLRTNFRSRSAAMAAQEWNIEAVDLLGML
ncbi:hypothetical protein V500_03917 [Pseudogymnoascus sp. VKM F-4518 (FW-2643)]|nr:hypothetical protein V500_03917 [Pseudogymnoascus sp. VKM F-4518 (FW-2643)]